MFIGIGYTIPQPKNPVGGGAPPATFFILAENGDFCITEEPIGSEDNMVTEDAP